MSKFKEQASHRQARVSAMIHALIGEALMNPKILSLAFSEDQIQISPISITRIKISPDLKLVYCYFVPFNTTLSYEMILKRLNNARFAIRHYITEKIQLKYSPEIKFIYDHGFENTYKVQELLSTISKEL